MRKRLSKIAAVILTGAMTATLFAGTTFAYDRQEAVSVESGTVVTVYAGTQNSNDQGNYLADPGDYEKFNRYMTDGAVVSTSNITSSTNYIEYINGGEIQLCNGGVEGVSWDENVLTLNNVDGTIITIDGPEINPYEVNTYNDKLNPVISSGAGDSDLTWATNLTYYKQYDLFAFGGDESGAPHTKDNTTVQDTIYINLIGENTFANLRVVGNVQVVFVGTGSITFDADSKVWDYDDYSDPDFDHLSDRSSMAVSSVETIGYRGTLEGEVQDIPMQNDRFKEIVTEWYEYNLPEFVLGEDVNITAGGAINNSGVLKDAYSFTYAGDGELGEAIPDGQPLANASTIVISGTRYELSYNDDMSQILVAVGVTEGRQTVYSYYDITKDVEVWNPFSSYIGADGSAASKVVISGAGIGEMVEVSTIGFLDYDGAKTSAVAVRYDVDLTGAEVSADDFVVETYATWNASSVNKGENAGAVEKVYVNDKPEVSAEGGSGTGKYVIFELNTDYMMLSGNATYQAGMAATVTQVKDITAGERVIKASEEPVINWTEVQSGRSTVKAANEGTYSLSGAERFQMFTGDNAFVAENCWDESTGEYGTVTISYALSVPEGYKAGGNYGLAIFIGSLGETSSDPLELLAGCHEGIDLASDEVQGYAKENGMDGLFVLALQSQGRPSADNFSNNGSQQAHWQLIDKIIADYGINSNNIYASGQSMGGMEILSMAAQRDNFFAGIWAVASQWGTDWEKGTVEYNGSTYYPFPADGTIIWTKDCDGNDCDYRNYFYMISDDNILITCGTGDALSYAGWNEVKYMLKDTVGITFPEATINPATATIEEQDAAMEALLAQDSDNGYHWLKLEGAEHTPTFCYAYQIHTGYKWLLSQKKETADARAKADINKPFEFADEQLEEEDRVLGTIKSTGETVYAVTAKAGSGTIGYNSAWANMGTLINHPGWTAKDGLVEENGEWVYYVNGKIDTEYVGFVEYDGAIFAVANGKVQTAANGLVQDVNNPETWYYCAEGQAQTSYTGLAQYDGAWFYVKAGVLDTTLAGNVRYDGGIFYVAAGRVVKELNGIAQDPITGDWYFYAEGQAQTEFSGTAVYDGATFVIENGKLVEEDKPVYDYAMKYLWYNADGSYTRTVRGSADRGFDMEKYINSPLGEFDMEHYYLTALGSKDQMASGLVAHWAAIGMQKVLYHADEEWDENSTCPDYAVYVPTNVATTEKMPVLFVNHGGGQNIYNIESFGYIEEAAERGWLVVAAHWGIGDETDVFDKLAEEEGCTRESYVFRATLAEIKENYNIDESRIYIAGYSGGGNAAGYMGQENADIVAAISPATGAAIQGSGVSGGSLGDDPLSLVKEYGLGMMMVYGMCDTELRWPISDQLNEMGKGVKKTLQERIDEVNAWVLACGGTTTTTLDEATAYLEQLGDGNDKLPASVQFGINFDNEYSQTVEGGLTYQFGEDYNADGKVVVKFMAVPQTGHWVSYNWAAQVCEFFSHFSRDTETHKLIVD